MLRCLRFESLSLRREEGRCLWGSKFLWHADVPLPQDTPFLTYLQGGQGAIPGRGVQAKWSCSRVPSDVLLPKLLLSTVYYEENFFVLQCLALVINYFNLRTSWGAKEVQKNLISRENLWLPQVRNSVPKDSKITLSVTNNFINTATAPGRRFPGCWKSMFGFAPHILKPTAVPPHGLFGKWQSWVLFWHWTIQDFSLWESYLPSQALG